MSAEPNDLNARLEAIAGLSEDYEQLLADLQAADLTPETVAATILGYKVPPVGIGRAVLRERIIAVTKGTVSSPAKLVDAWISEQSRGGEDDDALQGSAWTPAPIEPWEYPVDLADVLEEVRAVFAAYVYASDSSLDALALWTVYTHCFDAFDVAALLDLSSPAMRCGKSSTLTIIDALGNRTLIASNITPAAVFRCIEAWHPTLLIDEADTFASVSEELRGVLNSGHTRRTAFVIRVEGEAREPRMFNTFGPKAIAAIGSLPSTIEDRSVKITLTRKPASAERADAFDAEGVRLATEPTRSRIARAVDDRLAEIEAAVFDRPAGLHDRAWNNWRPLLSIASVAGGGWYERAVKAAVTLSSGSEEVDEHLLALRHVYEALVASPEGRLSTDAVLLTLVYRDDAPWAEKWARDLTEDLDRRDIRRPSAALAKLLKPFGIKPKQLWIAGANQRGYDVEWFESEAVAPFLVTPSEKDARDAGDARTEASAGAGSSDPSEPSDLSAPEAESEGESSW